MRKSINIKWALLFVLFIAIASAGCGGFGGQGGDGTTPEETATPFNALEGEWDAANGAIVTAEHNGNTIPMSMVSGHVSISIKSEGADEAIVIVSKNYSLSNVIEPAFNMISDSSEFTVMRTGANTFQFVNETEYTANIEVRTGDNTTLHVSEKGPVIFNGETYNLNIEYNLLKNIVPEPEPEPEPEPTPLNTLEGVWDTVSGAIGTAVHNGETILLRMEDGRIIIRRKDEAGGADQANFNVQRDYVLSNTVDSPFNMIYDFSVCTVRRTGTNTFETVDETTGYTMNIEVFTRENTTLHVSEKGPFIFNDETYILNIEYDLLKNNEPEPEPEPDPDPMPFNTLEGVWGAARGATIGTATAPNGVSIPLRLVSGSTRISLRDTGSNSANAIVYKDYSVVSTNTYDTAPFDRISDFLAPTIWRIDGNAFQFVSETGYIIDIEVSTSTIDGTTLHVIERGPFTFNGETYRLDIRYDLLKSVGQESPAMPLNVLNGEWGAVPGGIGTATRANGDKINLTMMSGDFIAEMAYGGADEAIFNLTRDYSLNSPFGSISEHLLYTRVNRIGDNTFRFVTNEGYSITMEVVTGILADDNITLHVIEEGPFTLNGETYRLDIGYDLVRKVLQP
ncbi:MAG: hypothetical protein LBQ58_10075 [Synergistaceae bacterium]|jgi:hypothetical protein|nr:hypothetical protein [Synergistaceae bacterium]